ncbi:MAG: sulfatase [Pseudomonadota bacterium]
MKKWVLPILAGIVVLGAVGWFYRIPLVIAYVEYRAAEVYADVAPHRDVDWSQGPAMPVETDGERPPNIILIVADDLGYNDISTFGGGLEGPNGPMQTPNIDRIAAEGAMFSQSYAGTGTCAPSRAMLMTGRYPARTGFAFTPMPDFFDRMIVEIQKTMDNNVPRAVLDEDAAEDQTPFEEQGLPSSEITVAEVLKSAGYYTAHIGKWHLGRRNGMLPHQQGFDDSLLMSGSLYLPKDHPDVVNSQNAFDPVDKFMWASGGFGVSFNSNNEEWFEPGGYLTDYWTDEAVKVIEGNKNRPFFLYMAHWGPHTPMQATRADYEAVGDILPHRKRVYAAMVRAVDRSVGRILDTLEAQGIADNTIVIFTSDNGAAGYIGIPEVNAPYRGWKITLFEGGIRVPMFVRWPGNIDPGTVVDTPVAHIDMMPTIAAAAGAALPSDVEIDGRDIFALTRQGGADAWTRETLFWINGHYQVVRHGDWKLQVNDRPTDGLQYWLYNLAEDPTEQNNLVKREPEKAQELLALLQAHQAKAREPLFASTLQGAIMVDKTMAERFEDGDEYIYMPN